MDNGDRPAPGWVVWNADTTGHVILAYRPDVFDSDAFPAPCLPILTVGRGANPNLPANRRAESEQWHVAAYLEPGVQLSDLETTHATRSGALEAARDAAARFARGEVPYRSAYQVPREEYLAKLDELTQA